MTGLATLWADLGLPASAVAGIPGGVAYALVGLGIVLLFRMGGVLSFTQGPLGVFGAVVFQRWVEAGHSVWLALLVGLAVSAGIGAGIGWVMARWFAAKSLLIRSAFTIAIAVSLSSL